MFLDHLDDPPLRQAIRRLIALRRRTGLHCRSKARPPRMLCAVALSRV